MANRELEARDHVFMVRTNSPQKWDDFLRQMRVCLEAVLSPFEGAEAVIWRVPAPKFRKRIVERVDPSPSPRQALERIAALMDGTEWSADTLDAIAETMRDAGFKIGQPWSK